jgi:hypothetical protein
MLHNAVLIEENYEQYFASNLATRGVCGKGEVVESPTLGNTHTNTHTHTHSLTHTHTHTY